MWRLIFFVILLGIIYWIVKQAFSAKKERPSRMDEPSEELVQDPVCKCYIPRSQAFVGSVRGKKISFCSEDCYRKYLVAEDLPRS